ncbi:MAG: NADH-quinone oxidoreductase subunit C [Anaerolineales bacterium]
MSWELVERLRERFPGVESLQQSAPPKEAAEEKPAPPPAGGEARQVSPGEAEPAAPATRLPPKREEPKAPVFLTPGAYVPAERLLEIARFAAEDPGFAMDYLSFVSGVDKPEAGQIDVVYHLFSTTHRHELLLKVRTDRANPRVDSVTRIWAGADWHEREAYDLLGITFEGHPNLRRIMMTEDWAGHPLRKDYVYEDPQWLTDLAKQRQREIDGFGLGERG